MDELNYAVGTGMGERRNYATLIEAIREADRLAGNSFSAWVRFIPTNRVLYIGKVRPLW